MTRRELAEAQDAQDVLAPMRARFALPQGVIYLDGNSLGPLPHDLRARVTRTLDEEWGQGLIRSWNDAGWIDLPERIGTRIARLIGAPVQSVLAADSTSINLFKLLSAALALRPERRVIVSERGNFPTDLYMAQGLIAQLDRGHRLVLVDDASEIPAALDGDTAVLMLTHVDYRSGAMHDMGALTRLAHEANALVLWDLAHSAGAVPLDLAGADVDFAVGCGYKYLNGGPGAPAFFHVAPRHADAFVQPLAGWFGHDAPFAFEPEYRPAPGAARYLCGTPPILAMAALDAALTLWDDVDIDAVRAKSLALTGAFIDTVEALCPDAGLTLITPRDPARRGSQVSFHHPQAYAVMQALIARGVIGDFRAPDILRFGFTPLYTRFVDVFDAVSVLAEVLETRSYTHPDFQKRARVT
ncbi:MAG: kynureninase [Salinarimonas sp.]|nr:kynureninase [Salinarimonas sp.]